MAFALQREKGSTSSPRWNISQTIFLKIVQIKNISVNKLKPFRQLISSLILFHLLNIKKICKSICTKRV